jgi:hypothetical protein
MNDTCGRAAIDTSAQRQKVTLRPGSSKVIPQPTSRSQSNLLFGRVIVNLTNGGFSPVEIVAQPAVKTKALNTDPFVSLGLNRLHPPAALSTVRPDGLEVQRGRDNLDIRQGELRSLGDDLSVESNQRRPIIIEPITVASLLIGVKVDTSELLRRVSWSCLIWRYCLSRDSL